MPMPLFQQWGTIRSPRSAAILATRRHLLPASHLADELLRLAPLVEKTGGPAEVRAFALLRAEIERPMG